MPMMLRLIAMICLCARPSFAQVSVDRVPHGGIAPQVVVDGAGKLHLIYFKGDPAHGDIFYASSGDGGQRFSRPMQVNSQAGSAIVVGSVRSPQLAVGRGGRAFVAWNGSDIAKPRADTTLPNKTPMLFSRMGDGDAGFEPQRNLIITHAGLDGGGSVAADDQGNVYVVWHAPREVPDEADRWVWVTKSTDDGKTFAEEAAANPDPTGACGCCGLKIATGKDGKIYLAYRTATDMVHRDMVLLASSDFGKTFTTIARDPWQANICVMSTAAISGNIAAWETQGQIRYTNLDAPTPTAVDVPGHADRKHPSIAINKTGDFILVWSEGTGWNKGGRVAWQLFDHNGRPVKAGAANDLPAWSQPVAFAKADGSFGVLY